MIEEKLNRVRIIHNGTEVMAASCKHPTPDNNEELLKLLKDLIAVLEEPVLEDKEIF